METWKSEVRKLKAQLKGVVEVRLCFIQNLACPQRVIVLYLVASAAAQYCQVLSGRSHPLISVSAVHLRLFCFCVRCHLNCVQVIGSEGLPGAEQEQEAGAQVGTAA